MTLPTLAIIIGAIALVVFCGWLFIGVLKKNEGGRRMSEWQPIETAPKGRGRRILVCVAGQDNCEVARWNDRLGKWCADFLGVRTDSTEWVLDGEHEPTHWMPLPTAPAPEGE